MTTNEELRAANKAIRDRLAGGIEARLRAIPGVIHVSVGLKQTGGRLTDRLCIRVYVREKRERPLVEQSQLIPPEIDGIPTDVNVVPSFGFQNDNSLYRPIKGGIQITNRIVDLNDDGTRTTISRGTLGCLAIDNRDKEPVLLSNWHVLYANSGRDGDPVFQPAPTSIEPADLADLPKRPKDDTNKIAVIRRKVISDKVDGAIAKVDVSSCCHCCGIHYTNDINGLSEGGRPPRTTIVGDETAVSGMPVFKYGQKTLRTEGRVVDDNYPTFTISRGGQNYTFNGQIAIQNVDHSVAFSEHGDSGSAVINLDNKIVGLLFAGGANLDVHGTRQPFVSLANHIHDVLTALNIRIPYGANVVTTAGEPLADVPVLEAPVPEPYRALRERLEARPSTARLVALGERHRDEIVALVNQRHRVTLAWHRCQGPALLATVMAAVRDGHYRMPGAINGVAPRDALVRMREVLIEHGSAALRATLQSADADLVIAECQDATDLHVLIERLADASFSAGAAR